MWSISSTLIARCYWLLIPCAHKAKLISINNSCSLISRGGLFEYSFHGSSIRFGAALTELDFELLLFSSAAKKQPLKTFNDIKGLIQQGKKREVKLLIRENAWPVNATIRSQLWVELCAQHHHGKGMLDGFYWDMVNQVCRRHFVFFYVSLLTEIVNQQVFGTTELPEKPIMLPPFVDSTHCLPYHLTKKGRAVADRVVSVLGYACPDITYSPSLYPITAILLHFMSGELKNKLTRNSIRYTLQWHSITRDKLSSQTAHDWVIDTQRSGANFLCVLTAQKLWRWTMFTFFISPRVINSRFIFLFTWARCFWVLFGSIAHYFCWFR